MSKALAALGVSADLAVHYARAGWLSGLARGVYRHPSDTLNLRPYLILMQRSIEGLHVGAKSALDWYGVRQYLSQHSMLHLYGGTNARLPDWFTERFPAEYHRKRLIDEPPAHPLHAGPFEKRDSAPRVSTPERALLEVLSEEGHRSHGLRSEIETFRENVRHLKRKSASAHDGKGGEVYSTVTDLARLRG